MHQPDSNPIATSCQRRNGLAVKAGSWWCLGVLLLAISPARPAAGGVTDLPGDLWDDVRHLPTRENAWWLAGGAATALLVSTFEDPEAVARTLNQPVIDELADFGNVWGDARVQAPLALATWGLGAWAGSEEAAGLGYDLTRSLALTYGAVSALKVTFNRERPNGEDYSFPSGHTASAFSTAGVVSRRYGGWAGGVAIGLGVLTEGGTGLESLYREECARHGTQPGMFVDTPKGSVSSAFVAEDPDEAWDHYGPYLLHDAQMYAEWMGDSHASVTKSVARDVAELRSEGGNYRIFSVDEAVAHVRANGMIALQPLCGGLPPELAWKSLRLVAEKVVPAVRG